MTTTRPASDRMDALERRIAKLEAQSQPLAKTCPKCHAFGLESYVRRTAFDGQGLQMMRCRFLRLCRGKKVRRREPFARAHRSWLTNTQR